MCKLCHSGKRLDFSRPHFPFLHSGGGNDSHGCEDPKMRLWVGYVCLPVCLSVVCADADMCVWKPQDNLGYCLSGSIHVFETVSHWLAREPQRRPSLCLSNARTISTPHICPFCACWGLNLDPHDYKMSTFSVGPCSQP